MDDLKKKILILLISILTIFLITVLFIFNKSIYDKEKKNLQDKLIIINNAHERFNFFEVPDKNPIFIGDELYEVTFDRFRNIDKIFSFHPDGLNYEEVKNLINNNKSKINNKKIDSLYKNDYIFILNRSGNLLIIGNQKTKNYLNGELIKSVIIFIFLETIIILSSLKITKWIVKPVYDSFEKQKQFIYDASHELKTPISIIGASIETLEKHPKETKWIETIKDENERMSKLISNLLDLSKSENKKEIYNQVNLSKIIEKKALSFESLIFENNLKLDVIIEKDILFNCSEEQIKELLNILVDNAIKHSLKESKITISLSKEKNNIILIVKNRGESIPKEEREKIFERFYRIDKSRNRDENRHGLGLSIAKNIVLNHDGSIKVECSSGYTSFIIEFKQN